MLQIVMRPAMSSARIASPANSITWPVPPAVPIRPMIASITSFARTPAPSMPSTRISMSFDGFCSSVWVASTCSTSDVPIPNASAPSAPWVDVWLSPQTIVMPGSEMPCSGPTMCTMPCSGDSSGK